MDSLIQDLKYGVRTLIRSPGFALVAMLSLALGIGANTAIFTVTNAVLLTSLPVHEPDQLMQVQTADLVARSTRTGSSLSAISLPIAVELANGTRMPRPPLSNSCACQYGVEMTALPAPNA